MLNNLLTKRLETLRESKDWTKTKVAKELDIPLATYASYESGKHTPDLYMLAKIADLYHVSFDFLVGHTLKSDYTVPEKISSLNEAIHFLQNFNLICESMNDEDIIQFANSLFFLIKKCK